VHVTCHHRQHTPSAAARVQDGVRQVLIAPIAQVGVEIATEGRRGLGAQTERAVVSQKDQMLAPCFVDQLLEPFGRGLEALHIEACGELIGERQLIAAHGALDSLMPFLHLPVQSGSDRILDAMNRRHTAADYRRLIERLRRARPDIALSSDFIVGFPGESDRDFAETLRLVNDVGFAQAYSFKYSPRPGTPAAALADQLPDGVKEERLAMLQALLNEQQRAFNLATLGKRLPVLLEKRGRREGQLGGRSPHMQAVAVRAPEARLGEIVAVEIEAAEAFSLRGRLLATADAAGLGANHERPVEMTA